jgi:lipopolysaccharide heptosyltransferase II
MSFASEISAKTIIKALYLNTRRFVLKTATFFLYQKKTDPLPENIQSILFIRVDRVGDMVLSTPAFRAIRAALPQVHLTVMASPANTSVLKNNPDVDDVVVYDRFAGVYEKIRFIKRLRLQHFSLAVDPCNDYELKTAFLTGMSGSAHRIGYAAFGREIFFNGAALRTDGNKHFVDETLDLLNNIGIPAGSRIPAIYISTDEQTWANNWMLENGFHDRKVIAIHPGAHYETQRWLPEYYAELIDLIRRQTQSDVILMGGATDAKTVDDILSMVKMDVCVCIHYDLRKFFALLSQCQVLVCNNSGPLHCAVALNIPTISFMGPTVKEQWMPMGEIHQVLRMDDLPCIACNLGYCKIKMHDCMRLIRPETVIDLLLERHRM